MKFNLWFEDLKEMALSDFDYEPEQSEMLDENTFEEYYDMGYTPKEALKEYQKEYDDE